MGRGSANAMGMCHLGMLILSAYGPAAHCRSCPAAGSPQPLPVTPSKPTHFYPPRALRVHCLPAAACIPARLGIFLFFFFF